MSDWASTWIEKLKGGSVVQFRPHGNSMSLKIKSGELCTVQPIDDGDEIREGDIVLCKVKGRSFLHLVSAVKNVTKDDGLYQISNTRGHINGWVTRRAIYGRLSKVEP